MFRGVPVKPVVGREMKTFARRFSWTGIPVGLITFWCGVWMAARRYPTEYDWFYMTLSNLLSPSRNPGGHGWATAGIILNGLGGLAWAAELSRNWKPEDPEGRPFGVRALYVGYLCLVGSALLPLRLIWLPKGHEILAILAFAGLCVGIIHLTFRVAERRFRRWTRGGAVNPRICAGLVAGAAVLPIALGGVTQAYVWYHLDTFHWVSIAWRARGVPVGLSFAFWEWVVCAVFTGYLAVVSLATRPATDSFVLPLR